MFCHCGIEHFCNAFQQFLIVNRKQNGYPQIMIPFDVCRDTQLMNRFGYNELQIFFYLFGWFFLVALYQPNDSLSQHLQIEGFSIK